MNTINDEMIEAAVDLIQDMSDTAYENLMQEFESSQEHIFNFLDEQLEEFQEDEEQEDIISIMLILFQVFKSAESEIPTITAKKVQAIKTEQIELFEEIQEISRSSDLLGDEDLSLFYIKNRALHDFILSSLDPSDDSPFDERSSEKAYLVIKICLEALSSKA